MKIPPWSYTFLNDYENCPHKAFRKYVVKDIKFVSTPAIDYGNRAHTALENALKGLRPMPSADEIGGSDAVSEPLSLKHKLPPQFAQWQHFITSLVSYKAQERHAELKLGMKEDGSPCSFWDGDVWGRGKVDVTLINTPTAAIFDWKTGKVREDASELECNAVLLKATYPGLTRIVGHYVWLKENRLGPAHDLSDSAVKLAYIRGVTEKIKRDMRFSSWQKNENALCGWCPCDGL